MYTHDVPSGDGSHISDGVLATAGRLFAELGYDEVSAQIIADACGIEHNVVADHYGGKAGLYMAVLRGLTELRIEHMTGALEDFTPDARGLKNVLDSYLDFCLRYPELPSLWMHRWLSDATDLPETEVREGLRGLDRIVELIAGAVADDVDPEVFAWNVIWTVNSFVRGGITSVAGVTRRADDPATLLRFRRYLHRTAEWAAGEHVPAGISKPEYR